MIPTPEYEKEFEEAMQDLESRDYFEVPPELHDRDFFSVKRVGAPKDCNKMESIQLLEELAWTDDELDMMLEHARVVQEALKWGENFEKLAQKGTRMELLECDKIEQACRDLNDMICQDEQVNHPAHYQSKSGLECIDVIEAFELNYHLANVLKYIIRAKNKGGVRDLKKAVWYLQREISNQEEEDIKDSE